MNKFFLTGRVGKLEATDGEYPKVSFSLVEKVRFKDSDGEWVEKNHWYWIQSFNPILIENVQKAIAVGDLLNIEGSLEPWRKEDRAKKAFGLNLNLIAFERLHRPAQKEQAADNSN
ncbi:single-stranded DNA-binding protein [Kiloniella laminariae]|uniref:Single-stranded DNA-binding protein n=1 Tax=Kiloniella laminariae TaxID=454162 RepID=A0ABT4LT24_9PROT|nr:single-stranded DNA-binding protein [Kiloniella laminariae]MCZ4283077.1 single-stranded DNA-binding protein [Kiloniella laminariae]